MEARNFVGMIFKDGTEEANPQIKFGLSLFFQSSPENTFIGFRKRKREREKH